MKYLSLLCVLFVIGCAGAGSMGPAGAYPGTIINDVTYPAANFNSTQYNFETADFDIVGEVSADATSTSILGILASGNSGYGELYSKAKGKYGADDVICVKVDVHYYNLLGIFSRVNTKLHGVAIKWKKK